jgi:predicted MPP superfamily phosphohydrolase
MIHEPDLVTEVPSWVNLQLSGHSHGGQICLPGGIPMMGTNLARVYLSGYYPEARVPVYVSRGIGTRHVNIRFYCRPEVTLMSLG